MNGRPCRLYANICPTCAKQALRCLRHIRSSHRPAVAYHGVRRALLVYAGNRDLPAELEQWAKKQTLAPESALGKQRVAQLRALGFTPAKAARKTPNAAKAKRSRAQRVRQVVRAGSR